MKAKAASVGASKLVGADPLLSGEPRAIGCRVLSPTSLEPRGDPFNTPESLFARHNTSDVDCQTLTPTAGGQMMGVAVRECFSRPPAGTLQSDSETWEV